MLLFDTGCCLHFFSCLSMASLASPVYFSCLLPRKSFSFNNQFAAEKVDTQHT